jgi:hypothetical protein
MAVITATVFVYIYFDLVRRPQSVCLPVGCPGTEHEDVGWAMLVSASSRGYVELMADKNRTVMSALTFRHRASYI